jgi:hypothetical protein
MSDQGLAEDRFYTGTCEGSVLYGDLRGVGFIGVFEFCCFLTQNLVHTY